MKKFFLFAAAAVAAMTVNAKVYNFGGIQSSAIIVDAQGAVSTYTMDEGKETEQIIPSVNYTSTVGALMNVTLSGLDGLTIQYKNGNETKDGHKDNILKFADKYLQADGKNVVLVLTGLKMDDEITLAVTAKGKDGSAFTSPDESASADKANPEKLAQGDPEKILKFYANGSTVTLKETAGGFRVRAIGINADIAEGIENAEVAPKAEKFFENGQLVIIKNGVKYNALGAQL